MTTLHAVRRMAPWLLITIVAVSWSVRPAAQPAAFVAKSVTRSPAADSTAVSETAPDVITIDWRVLRGLDFRRGTKTDTLKWLNGRRVRLPGFIVPLEDFQERAFEFLLVPYFGACVHLPPPPPNQMVYATLRSETPMALFYPVWIEGVLRIADYKSPYGVAGFRMQVERITPYEEK